jgi:hypothetical protein
MASTAVSAGGLAGPTVPAGPRRFRRFRPTLSTTPGRLRLLLIIAVLLSLAWGALAGFTASQYAAAASSVVATREPLSLDAQQIYSRLSDANDAAATAFLTGGLEPPAVRQRYLADIGAAESGIEDATANGGAASGAAAQDLDALAKDLPVYAGEVETARADNRLGLPLGAAYLREASGLMRAALLPAASGMDAAENASLGATSAQATGLPLISVTLAVGLVIGYLVYRASRWLRRRTNRVLNVGLVAAGVALIVSVGWLAAAYTAGRGDMLAAQARGSTPVEALAKVGIAAQQAHADESLTLIDNSGDDIYQQYYVSEQRALGPGPGTLLTAAQAAAAGSPAAPAASAAVRDARAWYAAHAAVRALDDKGSHAGAVASVLGTGPADADVLFAKLTDDLSAGMTADQATFDTSAQAGAGDFTALAPGVAVAALVMAASCAWGLSRRLGEYR